MKFFNKKNTYEILKEGRYDTIAFRKAVRLAYLSEKFNIYRVNDSVIFEQGAFRKVLVPVDIVEDIIGVEVSVPTRTA